MVFGLLKRKKKRTTRRKTVRRKKAVRKVRSRSRRKVKRKVKRKVRRKGKAFGGYQIMPDENLSKVIGSKAVSPSEMTKKLWTYIKRRRLARK